MLFKRKVAADDIKSAATCKEATKKMSLTTRAVNLVNEKAPHANLRVEALDCQQVTKKMPAQNSDMDLNL